MQASDRACFSGELRVERITASSLQRLKGHVSPYVRVVGPKGPVQEEHSRVITDASDPAIWLAKDLPDSGFIAFESVPLAAHFTFEVWDRREGGDTLLGRARVPLCSLRGCHGYTLPSSDSDTDTPDGRAASKVGPFVIERDDQPKETQTNGSIRIRLSLKCASLLDLGLFASHTESVLLALEQLKRVTLYGEPRDTLGDIRAAYWFDTVAPAPVRVNERRLNRIVELIDTSGELETIQYAAAQALVAFAMWHDEALSPMALLLQHNTAYTKAIKRVPEEQARRKKAGLPDTARSAHEIQVRLKNLLGEKVAKLEAFLSSTTPHPSPEPKPLPTPTLASQPIGGRSVTTQTGAAAAVVGPSHDIEDEEEDEDEEGEEEDESDAYYDLGLERMAALLAALDLLKYEPILRQKSVTVDYARRYSDQQFRELGLPLGVRVKLMEELKRLPL